MMDAFFEWSDSRILHRAIIQVVELSKKVKNCVVSLGRLLTFFLPRIKRR
jgi:hypothetical protein